MAQKAVELDQERFSCSICLELLQEPVTLSCGHNYCKDCVEKHWDGEDEKKVFSCPQCRKRYKRRPVLVKNTMLAELVEQLKKSRLQTDPADRCYAGAEDVACDFCSGRKLKAVKSCLQCLASYCEEHLQPHYESPTFKKHKLEEPSRRLLENICSHHNEVMKMFCRSDQKIICIICSMDEHKDHNTVSATVERADKQRALEGSRQNIQQEIQEREKDLKLLQELKAMSCSADTAVENSQKIFTQLIILVEEKRHDVEQKVRSQQEAEMRRLEELEKKLEQQIGELKRKDTELKKFSDTEDHSQFLQDYPFLSGLSGSTEDRPDICPLRHFEDVTAAVTELRDQLQEFLKVTQTKISETLTWPRNRAEFVQYSSELTLDPETATKGLVLSEGNRRATVSPSIFLIRAISSYYYQVLSPQSVSGRCYWEVEWSGAGASVAVAYNKQPSDELTFGLDDRSWALRWDKTSYRFWHNGVQTLVPGPVSSRVGVFLDHSAGFLAFYSISETMTLIHRVQTSFTQPLHAGLGLWSGATAEFCRLKQ